MEKKKKLIDVIEQTWKSGCKNCDFLIDGKCYMFSDGGKEKCSQFKPIVRPIK